MRGAVIVAAGKSSRFGKNKLNAAFFDETVLQKTVSLFCGLADQIVVVLGDDLMDIFRKNIKIRKYDKNQCENCFCDMTVDSTKTISTKISCVCGGESRSQSVKNGLDTISEQCDVVAIHDAARPFVSRKLIEKLFIAAEHFGSAIPRLPVSDTIWNFKGSVLPQNREDFFTVQTPQVFDRKKLIAAFSNSNEAFTDESTLYFKTYGEVHFVEGEFSNKKITVPSDLPTFSVGIGFDVHAFAEGNGIVLGGVSIPFSKKLVGHSDADVLTHAICDAVLSASANRDIGVQFPDTDDRYFGISSLLLLKKSLQLAEEKGFCVENISAVVICQMPKLAPFIDEMSRNIAHILKISQNCVNISATTTEHLGALGNGDGIAAEARALLAKKY